MPFENTECESVVTFKRYVPSYSKDVVRQIELWDKLLLKYPSIENSYYREKYDFKLSLSAGVFNNLYKQDCPLSRKEKVLR